MAGWRELPVLGPVRRYEQQTSRDRGTRDQTLPLSDYGNRDFNNFVCASEDASIGPNQASPLHFDQPRCAEDYVQGVVLGRFTGEGRLVRIWLGMTSVGINGATTQRLRIYVDDAPEPAVDAPLADVLDGSAGEMFAPPFGAGSPHRLSWYFPIAFQKKLIVALDGIGDLDGTYYQCDVVRDAVEHVSQHTQQRLLDAAAAHLTAFEQPVGGPPLERLAAEEARALAPGESRSLMVQGPGTIHAFEVVAAPEVWSKFAQVRVQVTWDDARDPSIDVALRDLFGGGARPPERPSLALATVATGGDERHALRLPMPFASRAALSFTNQGDAPVTFAVRLAGEARAPNGLFGRLQVQQRETRGPSDAAHHLAVQAKGRGKLAGVCVYVEGHADPNAKTQTDPLNLLEGDVHATIDGMLALDGTGSEEYADDVFYFLDGPQANAFVQAWDIVRDQTPGHASFCRWHVLGTELDFTSSIDLTFERGGANNPQIADLHRTVAYVYMAP